MSNLYARFKTNPDAESKIGVILDYGNGLTVRILRAGGSNRDFHRAMRESLNKLGRRLNALSDAESIKGLAEIYADAVIVGWEGVTDEEGKPLEFNKANVVKVLTDLPEFFRDIQDAAQNLELFRAQQKAEISGK